MAAETVGQVKNQTEQKVPVEKAEEVSAEGVFEKLPPEIKKVMEVGFSMQRFSGPIPSPFRIRVVLRIWLPPDK